MNEVRRVKRKQALRRPQDERVFEIMAAARKLIDAKGFETVTVAEIAEHAGVVEGTIYRYFKNKDELLLRVTVEWLDKRQGELVDVTAFNGTYNKLRYLIWHSLETVVLAPSLTRFVLTILRPRMDYKDTSIFELNRMYTSQIRNLFAAAIESGEFKAGVPERVLRDMVFGTIEHGTWRFLRGEGSLDIAELADEIATVVYRGMTANVSVDDKLNGLVGRLEAAVESLENGKRAK